MLTLGNGFDIVVVRELTGGIYFGQPKGREGETQLKKRLILRFTTVTKSNVLKIAFESARLRNKNVYSIDKANVLQSSILWREVVEEVAGRRCETEPHVHR